MDRLTEMGGFPGTSRSPASLWCGFTARGGRKGAGMFCREGGDVTGAGVGGMTKGAEEGVPIVGAYVGPAEIAFPMQEYCLYNTFKG